MTDKPQAEALKLLPCPFCGKEQASTDRMDTLQWDVECYCGAGIIACGPEGQSRDKAIAAWNTRATSEPSEAMVEVAIRQALEREWGHIVCNDGTPVLARAAIKALETRDGS